MNQDLKQYLLCMRDILYALPYLPAKLSLRFLWEWVRSLRPSMHTTQLGYKKRKHRVILNYLHKRYDRLLPSTIECNEDVDCSQLPIWFMWWQGKESMPPVVRLCWQSVLRNANGHPVHFIDKENYTQYAPLPQEILNVYARGGIKMAGVSDIIRLTLIYKWGGYWLDATLFVNRSLDISGLNHIFSSIKMKPLHPCTISDYRWAGFCLFAYPRSTAMKFFRDVMVQYFLDGHRYTIDYLFIDYTFQMLYERRPEFKNIIDNEPVGNEFTYELRNVLNSKPDFNQLASWKSQRIFKLGWNLPIINGDTTYNYLLNKT